MVFYLYSSSILAYQRSLIATLVSQWYFSKTRLWLSGTLMKGVKVVNTHFGSIVYHSYVVALIRPLRVIVLPFKRYFDRIKYANKSQIFLIKCCKLCVSCYESRWKYRTSEALYQVRSCFNLFRLRCSEIRLLLLGSKSIISNGEIGPDSKALTKNSGYFPLSKLSLYAPSHRLFLTKWWSMKRKSKKK